MESQELEQKWRDFLFLTQEMNKFLVQQDLDMFFALIDQRAVLQQRIEKIVDKAFYASNDAKILLEKIKIENNEMLKRFHMVFNAMKHKEGIVQQYEGTMNYTGNYLNKRT